MSPTNEELREAQRQREAQEALLDIRARLEIYKKIARHLTGIVYLICELHTGHKPKDYQS